MRPSDGEKPEPAAAASTEPEDVLPGAAAEPKAEWELQLEAEEAAEKATTPAESQAEKPGVTAGADAKGDEPGDLCTPVPSRRNGDERDQELDRKKVRNGWQSSARKT